MRKFNNKKNEAKEYIKIIYELKFLVSSKGKKDSIEITIQSISCSFLL